MMADNTTFEWLNCFSHKQVKACVTYRYGGESQSTYESFNLAAHVNDNRLTVMRNRKKLENITGMPNTPLWLNQTHSNNVIKAKDHAPEVSADGILSQDENTVLAILTADCLPILAYHPLRGSIGACHAGWRGLANGILPKLIRKMGEPLDQIEIWIGPGIGPNQFEVHTDVAKQLNQEVAQNLNNASKINVDLKQIAQQQLNQLGVKKITKDHRCTVETDHFFSYRRSQPSQTGRFASCIWLER